MMADLQKQVDDLTKERDELKEKLAKSSDAHQGALADLKTTSQQLAAATKERDAAVERAEKAEKAAETAGAKAKAAKKIAGPASRKVAKPDWGENDVDRPKPADLLEKIGKAETVEIVASDGEHEIRELGAMALEGNEPFRVGLQGLIANIGEGVVHGPGNGQGGGYRVEGFGLFLDGKLEAYAPLLSPVGVGPGQRVSFRDTVVF